jgi:endonuclease-3
VPKHIPSLQPKPTIKELQKRAKISANLLHKEYGSPRHGNKNNPLNELVFIILSLMTTHHSFNRVYAHLKQQVPTWQKLLNIRILTLSNIIKDGGLSAQKAKNLIQIMKALKARFGRVTLAPLKKMDTHTAEVFLLSLPGVGIKTAKCVLMYSLNREVLPVDTHVWRISKRLELVDESVTYGNVHEKLEECVLPADRYSFHVNAITHGREICIPLKPRCTECCLNRICPYPKHIPKDNLN